MFKDVSTISLLNQINDQSKVLDKIHSAVSERGDDFEFKYIKPLRVLGDWIGQLPCSKAHHSESSGTIRLAAHAGFIALRLADAVIFTPPHLSEFRSKLEPQSRYATYLATVFSVLAYPLTYVDVVADDGERWDKTTGLNEFVNKKHACVIEWTNATQLDLKKGAFHGSRLMPIELISNLDPMVSAQLMTAIPTESMNVTGNESIMQKIVKQALHKAIDADVDNLQKQFAPPATPIGEVSDYQQHTHHDGQAVPQQEPILDTSGKVKVSLPVINDADEKKQSNLMDELDAAVKDIFDMLVDDIKSDASIKKKIHITETGMTVPSSVFSHYGLPLNIVEADLRKKGGLIKKEGQTFHVSKQIGDWVVAQLGDVFV